MTFHQLAVLDDTNVVQVRRGVIQLSRRLRAEKQVQGMSSTKVALLGHLVRNGPMTPGHLAQVEFVQPQSLSRVLAEMAESGLVSRTDHPDDGRQFLINVTALGRRSLSEDMRSRDAWLQQAMLQLTEAERQVLGIAAGLMERMADSD